MTTAYQHATIAQMTDAQLLAQYVGNCRNYRDARPFERLYWDTGRRLYWAEVNRRGLVEQAKRALIEAGMLKPKPEQP